MYCVLAMPIWGQSLRLSSASGYAGDYIALDVSMDAPREQRPSVLKWETIFPAQLLEPDASGPEASEMAKAAGKSITCMLRQTYAYVCILVGGQKPVDSGKVATFRFKIRSRARTGTALVRIDQVEAATADLQPLKFLGSEGQIEIH